MAQQATNHEGGSAPSERDIALGDLFSVAYEELRRLAYAVRRGEPSETLNPTALVNEAYLRLVSSLQIELASRLHFKRIAARAMRQVLIEAARRRSTLKRGGDLAFVTLDESIDGVTGRSNDLLALDGALDDLGRMHPRHAAVVELRFFGGFDVAETAAILEVSESTVTRDWRAAKAWLAVELRPAP